MDNLKLIFGGIIIRMGIYKGCYKKGIVSKTEGQIKKHAMQMDDIEKQIITNRICKLVTQPLCLDKHLHYRKYIRFKKQDFIRILLKPNVKDLIVEYNCVNQDDYQDYRVLIRDNEEIPVYIKNVKTKKAAWKLCNLCFVYSLKTNRVITAYWNLASDNHQNINWNRYDANLQVIVPGCTRSINERL